MFSVDEEINLSDDEINFSILQTPQIPSKTQPATDESKRDSPKPKRFKFVKTPNIQKISPEITKPKLVKTPSCELDDFFGEDSDDDLLSQIEIPDHVNTNLNLSSATAKHVEKRTSVTKENKIKHDVTKTPTSCIKNITRVAEESEVLKTPNQMQCTPIKYDSGSSKGSSLLRSKYSKSANKTIQTPLTAKTLRKFPGPAGNLPELTNFKDINTLRSPEIYKDKQPLTPQTPKTPLQNMISMSQENDIHTDLWDEMSTVLKRKFPNENIENISEVLSKASQRRLDKCKVPLMCGIIKSFSIIGNSARLLLNDRTGDIHGAVHSDILEEYQNGMQRGSGLILKDVSVFSPTLKKHYLNITPSNIAAFFERDIQEEPLTQATQFEKRNLHSSTIIIDSGQEKSKNS